MHGASVQIRCKVKSFTPHIGQYAKIPKRQYNQHAEAKGEVMTFLQAAGLGLRLFALWVFLFSIQAFAATLALIKNGGFESAPSLLVFIPTGIALLLGVTIWRFPLAIARVLVPRGSDTATAITMQECWKLGSVLIGLLVLAQSGPLLLGSLAFVVYRAHHAVGEMPEAFQGALVEAIFKTIFALFLIFGSSAIYRKFGAGKI
jgi:hypothetical protein